MWSTLHEPLVHTTHTKLKVPVSTSRLTHLFFSEHSLHLSSTPTHITVWGTRLSFARRRDLLSLNIQQGVICEHFVLRLVSKEIWLWDDFKNKLNHHRGTSAVLKS